MTTYNRMAAQLQDSVLLDITGDSSPDTKKLMVDWVGAVWHSTSSVAMVPCARPTQPHVQLHFTITIGWPLGRLL